MITEPKKRRPGTPAARKIGRRLRELRERKGLSQRQLAYDGCTAAYISRLEKGERYPSYWTLMNLGARLGVSAEFLELGVDRTPTDDLADELVALTGQGIATVAFRGGDDPGVALTFGYREESRTAQGETLTEALRSALAWTIAVEQLTEKSDRLDGEMETAT